MPGLTDDNAAVIFTQNVKIGQIVPDCVVEETYEDRIQITSHPVEKGAHISDHAFKMARGIEMRIGWADGKTNQGYPRRSLDQYNKLLELQKSLEPLDVSSGKQMYKNMLIQTISMTNDQKMKHAVVAVVRLIEVRFANARDEIKSSPPATAQTAPQTSQPPTSQGPVQPKPAGTSDAPKDPNKPPDAADHVFCPPIPPELLNPPQPGPIQQRVRIGALSAQPRGTRRFGVGVTP